MKKRGQIAVEYLVISAVAVSIALGGWYIVQDSLDEYQDRVQLDKMETFVKQVIAGTEEVVYLGEGAKKTINIDIPKRMKIMEVIKEGDQYYLHILIETSDGETDLYYDLPVELRGCGISGCGVCAEEGS